MSTRGLETWTNDGGKRRSGGSSLRLGDGSASERSMEVSSSSVNAASYRSKADFVQVYPDLVFDVVNDSTYHLVTIMN
jgi:hypothetical protein